MIPLRKITTLDEMVDLILSIPESVRDDTEICLEILRKGYHPNSVHMIDAAQDRIAMQKLEMAA
jgi:hypothetical protein